MYQSVGLINLGQLSIAPWDRARVMIRSCDGAKQETQKWLPLLHKEQDAELTESRLGQTCDAQSDCYAAGAAKVLDGARTVSGNSH